VVALKHSGCFVAQWLLCSTVVALKHSGCFEAQWLLCSTVVALKHSGCFVAQWLLCSTVVALKHSGCFVDQLLQSLNILFFMNLLKSVNIPRQKSWSQFCFKRGGTVYRGS